MLRSSKGIKLLRWLVLMIVVGLGVLPAGPGLAAPHGAATPGPAQIIYLDASGQLIAQKWSPSARSLSTVWSSGSDTGWTNFITADVDGDGKADIIAASPTTLKIFYPTRRTSTPVATAPPGYTWNLLAAGDFKHLGRDQIAASFAWIDDAGWHEGINVYTLDPAGNMAPQLLSSYPFRLQAMAGGDVNRDGYADLTILAQGNQSIFILSGRDLTTYLYDPPENGYCCAWNAVAVGQVDKDNSDRDHTGNEIVLSRQAGPSLHSVLLGWYLDNRSPQDVHTLQTFEPHDYAHYPFFDALALADLDGDPQGDLEILALRDPGEDKAYLVTLNPSGPPMRTFEAYGYDYGANRFNKVAAGDINGDGKAEVVLVRSAGLRVFYQPALNNDFVDFSGTLLPVALAVADLGIGAGTP